MASTKEFREFFLRNVRVTSGSKPDQEASFPTSYYIGSNLVYNRFLKTNYPSENVFKKLFESLTFKLNKEDTAQLTQQGLAKKATDVQAISRTSNADIDFTAFVTPHQLTEIISLIIGGQDAVNSTTTGEGITIKAITRTIAGKARRVYQVIAALANSIEFDGDGLIQLQNDTNTPGNYFYYGTNAAGLKGWYNLAALIVSIADDEIDTIVTPLLRHKFVKTYIPDVSDEVIPYTEISASGIFNVDRLGTSTTNSPKTDYVVTVLHLGTLPGAEWTHVNSAYTIHPTTGDLTIPAIALGIVRVIIIG